MVKYKRANKSGFTLVELVAVLAILMIVIISVFSLFQFGKKVYDNSSRQSMMQSSIRLASDVIRDKIRYATSVDVLATYDALTAYNYIKISDDYQSILYIESGIPVELLHSSIPNVALDATFSFNSTPMVTGNVLKFSNTLSSTTLNEKLSFTLSATSSPDNKQYHVSTEIDLMNVNSHLPNTDILAGPIASVESGLVSGGTVITLSAESGALIYYTYDMNSDLTALTGTLYPGNGIAIAESTSFRAIAVKNGVQSDVSTFNYYITVQVPNISEIYIKKTDGTTAPDYKKNRTIMVFYGYDSLKTQGNTIITWYRSSTKVDIGSLPGDAVQIGASIYNSGDTTTMQYILINNDVDKYIYVGVKPVDSDGIPGEYCYYSDFILVRN